MRGTLLKALPLLLASALLLAPRPAPACAMAFRPGSSGHIAREEALIVWDGQTQHFIRRAQFATSAEDMGFIVPTPTRPDLAEVEDAVFERFEQVLADALTPTTELDFVASSALFTRGRLTVGPSAAALSGEASPVKRIESFGVKVLQERNLAGMDITVLEADDAGALRHWLEARGFDARPALMEWLKPYIAQRWKLTAFKHRKRGYGDELTSSTVRLSFRAERPFYPYREPSDTDHERQRTLRLYFVGPSSMQATLGERRDAWNAKVRLARELKSPGALLASAVPAGTQREGAWLTIFDDDSRQRAWGEELDFQPSPTPEPYEPPRPVIQRRVRVPVELGLAPLALLCFVWFARGRRLGTPDEDY